MQALLQLRSGITVSSRWQSKPRFGIAVASQRLHAGNASLASASLWHRSVFALAIQQWHRCNFTLAIQASYAYL